MLCPTCYQAISTNRSTHRAWWAMQLCATLYFRTKKQHWNIKSTIVCLQTKCTVNLLCISCQNCKGMRKCTRRAQYRASKIEKGMHCKMTICLKQKSALVPLDHSQQYSHQVRRSCCPALQCHHYQWLSWFLKLFALFFSCSYESPSYHDGWLGLYRIHI